MKLYSDRPNHGVSFPSSSQPSLKMNHIDGPLLTFSDGQMHWLSIGQRLRVALGLTNAEKLQRELRPRLTRALDRARLVTRNRERREMNALKDVKSYMGFWGWTDGGAPGSVKLDADGCEVARHGDAEWIDDVQEACDTLGRIAARANSFSSTERGAK